MLRVILNKNFALKTYMFSSFNVFSFFQSQSLTLFNLRKYDKIDGEACDHVMQKKSSSEVFGNHLLTYEALFAKNQMVKQLKVSFFCLCFFCTYVVSKFDSLVFVAGCRFCYIDGNF
jgi:hypothetical protein